MSTTETPDAILWRLGDLKTLLNGAGFLARLSDPGGASPCLLIIHPAASYLDVTIRCDLHPVDEVLWFFWSWGEPICPAGEVGQASREIDRVLGSRW